MPTSPPLALSLDDDTNESLMMHDIARMLRRLIDRRMQGLTLTRSQWIVLAALRRNEGVRQVVLADFIDVEPITLARLLDKLEAGGWVTRMEDPTDRRAKRIYPTDKARALMQEMRTLMLDIRREALQGFTAGEHAALVAALSRLKANVAHCLNTSS